MHEAAVKTMRLPANYYQQFDADLARDVPGEGYGGWRKSPIEIAPDRTALVVMHAWDCGTPEDFPGWYRAVEYLPRARVICRTVFPALLTAVRASPLRLFHVIGGGPTAYREQYPGYHRAKALAGPPPEPPEQTAADPVLDRLRQFRDKRVFGEHNQEDIKRGFDQLDIPVEARPLEREGVAENAHQLRALCREDGVNHLIYTGFAINWCLLLSAGGMAEMSRHGFLCSTIREAVTAVENRETARRELCKELALWRVAVAFGFVFDLGDFLAALAGDAP